MPIPEQRDRAEAARRLAGWLAERLGADGAVDISDVHGPTATGFSSETLIVNARWTAQGSAQERTFVFRVAPTGHSVFMQPNLDVQFRVMQTLAAHSGI